MSLIVILLSLSDIVKILGRAEKVLLSLPPILSLYPVLKFAKGTFVPIETLHQFDHSATFTFLFCVDINFEMIDQ